MPSSLAWWGAILYFVINSISLNLKIKREELKKEDIQDGVENIEDVDIESLLARAREEGNFKIAIRLYYLLLLKKLHTLNVIVWKKDKTNRDYLSELFSRNFYFDEIPGYLYFSLSETHSAGNLKMAIAALGNKYSKGIRS